MNKFIIVIMSALLVSLGLSNTCLAKTEKYQLNVHDFAELKVIDGLNVEYTTSADSAGWVSFECEPQYASHLMFTNDKNILKIQIDFENLPTGSLPTVYVRSSSLLKVENSGDSTVTINNLKEVNTFNARLIGNGTLIVKNVKADNVKASISTGAGHMVISGQAERAKLSNIGTGPLEATHLKCQTVKCWLVGTGPIDCYVTEELKVLGAGSGTVYYGGNPKKVTNHTIGVKIQEVK